MDVRLAYEQWLKDFAGDADTVADWAGVKSTDAALLSESGSKGLSHRGFSGVTAWAETSWVLVK